MMLLLIAVFTAIALFAAIALIIFMAVGERTPAEIRLAQLGSLTGASEQQTEGLDVLKAQDIFAVLTRPLAPFREWLRSRDSELSYRLSIAGFRKVEDADTFLSCKLLFPILGILLATFAGSGNFLFAAAILGVLGFFVPDIYLFRAMGQRKQKIERALPDALDLLVICMEAGLGIDQATLRIAKEIEFVYPELSEELLMIGYEQRVGKPRLDAWRAMADRVGLDVVNSFVAMLVQTEKLGTPIARALGQFADSLRTTRLMRAEEQAAKTTVKLIFPLALFIFPALFVVLLGPGVLTVLKALNNGT